jgi:hypothetical protein
VQTAPDQLVKLLPSHITATTYTTWVYDNGALISRANVLPHGLNNTVTDILVIPTIKGCYWRDHSSVTRHLGENVEIYAFISLPTGGV